MFELMIRGAERLGYESGESFVWGLLIGSSFSLACIVYACIHYVLSELNRRHRSVRRSVTKRDKIILPNLIED